MSQVLKSSDAPATERLRAGKQITVVVDAGSAALVERFQDGVADALDKRALAAGESYTFGEYTIDVMLRISCVSGSLSYSESQSTGTVSEALADGPGSGMGAGSVPAAVAQYVTAREYGNEACRKTILTINALPLTILNAVAANQASGAKVYDFPQGRIKMLAAAAVIAETTTSAILTTLNGGKTCKFGVGSTIGVNATLATTEQDIVPVTSVTSSATINVAGASARAALAASADFDGHAAALDAYLNFSVPTDGDLDGDATVTLSGTITMTWAPQADV